MKFDTIINLALAAIVFKFVYDASHVIDNGKVGVIDFFKNDVNPASSENIIYRGANWLGEEITGEEDWSVGTAIYDWFN